MSVQSDFLLRASNAAAAAKHIFPEFAACEAALESGWGHSELAMQANNLFGQKQSHPPVAGSGTLALPTREYLHGSWVTVQANWTRFADWGACFAARMQLLERLRSTDSHYAAALQATNGEQFITEVSKSWSTDPQRAGKVLSIYDAHKDVFAPPSEEKAGIALPKNSTM
jgi:flagellum-specific peptidoglycan hydrolase FlgJ